MSGSITGVHHEFVKSALPYWYVSATAEQRLSLHRDILAGRLLQVEKVNVLRGLKGLREFAKGKLAQALDAHDMFGTGFDVEHDEIWIAQLETRGASSGPAGVSGGRAEVVTGYRKTTLLQAALHNYRNDEVEAVRQERYSRLQRVASSVVRPASAARFMAFCRALDVGGQYQSHLHAVLNPTAQALAGGAPGADEIRQAIDRCARNALHIEAHIAYMQGPLKADDYHAVLSACAYDDGRPPQTAAAVWSLSMLGFNLADVLVFTPPVTGGYIVYIPGEPHSVFRKHSSLDELTAWLRLMLGYERYQRLFADFVDKGKQRQFLTRLNRHLKPEVPTPYRGKPDLDLDLRLHPIVNLATDHFSRKALAAIRSEARALAVPTEDRDQAEDAASLDSRWQAVMNMLNLGALFVPGLGEIVTAVVGVQLLGEVFEGINAWQQGDMEDALEHLSSVALNLAALLIVHQAGKLLVPDKIPAIKPSAFVDKMVPIQLDSGKTRLWTADLAPFAAPVRLPDEVQPTAEGLFIHGGRQYITLQGRFYRVERDAALNKWRVKLTGNERLSPILEHNGDGAWRHESEDIAAWDAATSLRRLGPRFAGLSAHEAGQVMQISGCDERLLSALHLDNRPPPAALVDTLERFELDRQASAVAAEGEELAGVFERLNQQREATDEPGVNLLQRDFPGLPTLFAREVLAEATEQQRATLLATQRIPLAINGRVRDALQASRLNRALEGFFLRSRAQEPDTQKLAAHLLQRLPGGVPSEQWARRIGREASSHRQRSAKILGLQPIKPVFTGPMRLADGRPGYRLSGRGRLGSVIELERSHLARDLARLYPDALNIDRYIADQEAAGRTVEQLRHEVRGLMREWLDLDATLGVWVEPVGPAEALSAQRRGVREQVSAALISAWRADSAALSMMPGPRALTLRNVDMAELAELPDLPEPYARISRIHLDAVTASAEQLDGFVRRFANVVELSINNVLFTRLPGQLAALERLSRLTLTGVRGMAIDQDVMDRLMQLSGLTALDLSENVFGEISRFDHPALRDLMLRNAQLTQWPQWVDDLSLSSLDISANEIEHLPRRIIENEGQASPPMVIHAYGNPLDQEELSQFWDSNQGRSGGRYRVEADSVSALNWEDSSEAGSEVWSDWDWEAEHGSGPSSLPVEPDVAIWRIDEPGREAMNARLHVDWQTLEQAADAPNLLKLIQRLKETPDFNNSHASLAMDVRDVLEAAAHDPALRERLNAMAYDRLSGTGQTCQDGVRLIFSDIRIAVLESAALRDEPHFRHGEALLRMVRSLFRLSEVESIAAEDIALRSGQVDAAEVRMAYRIGLAEELQLPGQPSSMQWERVAAVSPQAIDNARFEVLTREQGTALIEYAASNSRWVEFLRQFCADDFARLRALYDEQMEALEADAEEFDRQSEALMNRHQVSERLLLEQLTQNLVDEYF